MMRDLPNAGKLTWLNTAVNAAALAIACFAFLALTSVDLTDVDPFTLRWIA
jgi:hypothetical protein